MTTIQSLGCSSLPDLVKRECDPGELNMVWMSDITFPRTREGWLYLCAIRDGRCRRVVGWATDDVQDANLIKQALRMDYTLRGKALTDWCFMLMVTLKFTSDQLWMVRPELADCPVGRSNWRVLR
ncbi:hypothetical protein [Corynebacterium zhongnanshanii]|uniref:hypothetical protein n=1 Tax=Corynebacterium zhongnanshanii TaxID=2768834 RepID=UPI00186586A9|nr:MULTISPECIES: hypothetical protein [Corynebacterium]